MNCKSLWFDLDYTLYDMSLYLKLVFEDVAKALCIVANANPDEVEAALFQTFEKYGSRYERLFDTALAPLALATKENIRHCVAIYHAPPSLRTNTLALYGDVLPVFIALSRQYTLGILTNGNPAMQRRKINMLGLKKYVDHVVCAADIEPKPSPKPYMAAAALSGCRSQELIYMGDNPHVDFHGAKQAGCGTVRILRGEFKSAICNERYIDWAVESMADLHNILKFETH